MWQLQFTHSIAVLRLTSRKGITKQQINQMSIIFMSEVGGNSSILLVKMVVITNMIVRFTAMASLKRSWSKKILVKVMSSRRMVGKKVVTELMTTYLHTILLLLITYTTVFFEKVLFGYVIAVNLTIMLVMTTIFTSKIEELPPTSDMKMIDIWLIFCLVVPFLEVILRTAIECLNCSCFNCEPRDANKTKVTGKRNTEKEGGEAEDSRSSSSSIATRAKVAPTEQVLVL